MIFTTPEFLLFALVFAPLFFATRGSARRWILLLGSYAFYAAWDPRFLVLLAGSTVLDFTIAKSIATSSSAGRRRSLLQVSVVCNLGVLALVKYLGFFVASFASLLGRLGVEADLPTLALILPVGISFYTFQTLGYTIDVYRREQEPATSLLDFANYVAFFPQLVAGPIERASRLLPQLERVGGPRASDSSGFAYIAIGVVKKVVFADNLGAFVDTVYAAPETAYPPVLLLATYAFAVQIYCDFSGYSDIAVGIAKLMGIELMQNFDAPYAATGPRDLWRRWHISLSTWLRDYLYIPLGGNRSAGARVKANLLITMLLGGLWHGAAWNFVAWGAFHGVLLMLGRIPAIASAGERVPAWLRRVLFFQLVCVGWILFRVDSLGDGVTILSRIVDVGGWELGAWLERVSAAGVQRYVALLTAMVAVVIGVQMFTRRETPQMVARLWSAPWVVRLYVVVLLVYAAVILAPEQPPAFIYFQF